MVLTAYFVLSPAIGLVCHRHPADMADPRPVGPTVPPLDLTPASRRQDHTTSPSASASFVSAPFDRSQIQRTRPASRVTPDAAASTASHPASVTIAIRPSGGRDGGINKSVSTKRRSEIFLRKGLDTNLARQPVGQISGSRTKRRSSVRRLIEPTPLYAPHRCGKAGVGGKASLEWR